MKSRALQFRSLPQTPSQKLAPLYARIPSIACKGLCQECCGPIAFHPIEVDHLRSRGIALPVLDSLETMNCSALDAESGRCTIYDARPLICRLWGVVPGMPCPWGCVPDRLMTREEALSLMTAIHNLSPGELHSTMGDMSDAEAWEAIDRFVAAERAKAGML